MAAHPIDDPILSHTNAYDVSINTVNCAEALAGSHIIRYDITQRSTYTLHISNWRGELLTIDAYVPPDSSEDNEMYQFMDNYNEWDKSPNTAGVNDMGISHPFMTDNASNSINESIESGFGIGKRQP